MADALPPPPPPPMPPPISNPADDEGLRIVVAVSTVTALALVTVFTRLYVRAIMIRSLGWDDAMMALTMAVSLAGLGLVIASVEYGAGRHRGDVDPDVFNMGMKINFISQPMYLFGICFVKLAVGASLLRIASTKFYTRLIIGIMGFMLFYTIGCFFTIIFQCTDIRVIWDPTVKATCWSISTLQSLSYTNVALNILTDFLFAVIIPAPMLWKLNVQRRTRITLLAILGLGVFACAAAFIKVGYLVNYGKVGDFLWDSRDITIWTATEMNIGVVAGSLPCLRPLFRTILGLTTYGKGSRKTAPSGYANGTGNRSRSGSNWQSLSSGPRPKGTFPDDSSQEGINTQADGFNFELQKQPRIDTMVVAQNGRADDKI